MTRPKLTENELLLLEKLRKLRNAKDLKQLPPNTFLKKEIVNLEGETIPFTLRYYQTQGILNMLLVPRMVLGDGTGLGKCVTLDTLLLTDKGLRPLVDLRPPNVRGEGFYDMTTPYSVWNGETFSKVKRFYWQGQVPTVRLKTRLGYVLEGSQMHPIWVRDSSGTERYVKLKDIKKRDFVCLSRSKPPFPTAQVLLDNGQPLSLEVAHVLGWILSTEIPRKAKKLTIELDNLCAYIGASFKWTVKKSAKFFAENGMPELLHEKQRIIPALLLQSPETHIRAFLQTYFEFAGVVINNGIESYTGSRVFVQQLQSLLLLFGVPARVSPASKGVWRLSIFDEYAKKFLSTVGVLSKEKTKLLATSVKMYANLHEDRLPHVDVKALEVLLLKVVEKQPVSKLGYNFKASFKKVVYGTSQPSRHMVEALLQAATKLGLETTPEYETLKESTLSEYFYDYIEKVDEGLSEVADIEVDDASHSFIGNGFINHNTIQTIGTLSYLYDKKPEMKTLVVAPKSAIRQWASEIAKFTEGINTYVISAGLKVGKDETGADARARIYEAWRSDPKPSVLIINYALLVRDWNHGCYVPLRPDGKPDPKQPVTPGLLDKILSGVGQNLTVVFDEATGFKSRKTKTWEIAQFLSAYASRVYALTATLLKNNLMEGYNILKAIRPKTFGNLTEFYEDYCYVERKSAGKGKQIVMVKGYKNLDKFRENIELVYLGRPKHLVSNELPTLVPKEVTFELNPAEQLKYAEALEGVLELGDGEVKDYEETKALTSLIYCQQIVNSLFLLKFKDDAEITEWSDPKGIKVGVVSSKEQALLDLLEDELEDDKVIVYTRFASHVPRLKELLKQHKIESVSITGKEKDEQRKAAQDAFQNLKSKTRVVFITAAGSEAINLQAAAATVFFDMPWSWGEYVQVLGRMIRIGSPHKGVVCIHLLAELPGVGRERKTIDHHVLAMLRKKKGLIDKVLGEAVVGALKFEKGADNVKDLIRALKIK